ncbi:Restriction endonuclease S subunit [Treponema sp. JC4]|uniref:restriction endonuclease subunit S n=1 Tax=Treponema sp. JC4 TaxID=1124982 RepID=UPI00025B0E62|nr:restriction endonuclease subunit S [Treponema sp. JC4]EID84380.1 Restriction endonuclease S subunit [Treponema sp. JC4]
MKAEYRKLGEYIQPVDVRNSDLKVNHLLGVSVEKRFIESIANTIGTDFSKYKIVRKGQFTYIPDTSRRGDKIGIALLSDYEEGLVSNIYTVFEITDTSKLLPEYLMLWFSRPEFDRYARFKSHGSVREIFDWDEMCRVELPVPDIKEQQKIVNTYNAITKRIQIKQKINENLEKTAITILNEKIGQCVFTNSTENEIKERRKSLPQKWGIIKISEFCSKMESGSTPSRTEPTYWVKGTIPWVKSGEVHNNITLETEENITEKGLKESSTKLLPKDTVLIAMYGVTAGEVGYLNIEATTNQAICAMICKNKIEAAYLYYALIQNQEMISQMSNGGAQNNLSKAFIENMYLVVPDEDTFKKLSLDVVIMNYILITKEIAKLQELKQLVISRISEM